MTTVPRHRLLCCLAGLAMACIAAGPVGAQQAPDLAAQPTDGLELIKGGPTPKAINGVGDLERSCPLLVKLEDAALQPLWIPPAQVAAKNRLGCLSAADGIYGTDGCPTRLCGQGRGEIALPAAVVPTSPQLPEP